MIQFFFIFDMSYIDSKNKSNFSHNHDLDITLQKLRSFPLTQMYIDIYGAIYICEWTI